jgi:hypothetical protein
MAVVAETQSAISFGESIEPNDPCLGADEAVRSFALFADLLSLTTLAFNLCCLPITTIRSIGSCEPKTLMVLRPNE